MQNLLVLPLALAAMVTAAPANPYAGCFRCLRETALYPAVTPPWFDSVTDGEHFHAVPNQERTECGRLQEPTRAVCLKGYDRRFTDAYYDDGTIRITVNRVTVSDIWDLGLDKEEAPEYQSDIKKPVVDFVVIVRDKNLARKPDPRRFRFLGPCPGAHKTAESAFDFSVIADHAVTFCRQGEQFCDAKDAQPYPPGFHAYNLRLRADPTVLDKCILRVSGALGVPAPDLHFRRFTRIWFAPIP
jgi:hypothetical protein